MGEAHGKLGFPFLCLRIGILDCLEDAHLFLVQVKEYIGDIQFPSHEANVEHLDCLEDDLVGYKMKLTMHRKDNYFCLICLHS
jgi:hypothetical protein